MRQYAGVHNGISCSEIRTVADPFPLGLEKVHIVNSYLKGFFLPPASSSSEYLQNGINGSSALFCVQNLSSFESKRHRPNVALNALADQSDCQDGKVFCVKARMGFSQSTTHS